ncbi:MAG TPA: DeoR family transcriptional regulator, partial [Escherichia coli]|nr:DeoR family transcriptional regulator [Escherichia coli]
MKQTQRHNGIIELVKQQGYVSTEELVEHFSVSPQTIRRDLNELAEQNLILRHHGGAALPYLAGRLDQCHRNIPACSSVITSSTAGFFSTGC